MPISRSKSHQKIWLSKISYKKGVKSSHLPRDKTNNKTRLSCDTDELYDKEFKITMIYILKNLMIEVDTCNIR